MNDEDFGFYRGLLAALLGEDFLLVLSALGAVAMILYTVLT